MDLVALQIFKAVAESGGVTRAAARLHRVQSNVTTRVKQLEAQLGTPLFHRHKGRLTLSAEGRVLLGYAERLLRLSAEAETALRDGTPRGLLRFGSLESTAAVRLPALLGRYHRAWPEVQLQLVTGTTGDLVARVLNGELEAAFVAEPFTAQGLDALHAFTEELVLIAPRGLREFGHVPVLAFAAGCSYRLRLQTWLQRSGIAPTRVMEYGSYHAIVACVAAGAGIALVPRSILGAVRHDAGLDLHPLPHDMAHAKTMLVWRTGHRSQTLDALKSGLATSAQRAALPRRAGQSPASRSGAPRRGAARPPRRSSMRAASR